MIEEKICPVCKKHHNNPLSDLCFKHHNQMYKYKKIKSTTSRTIREKNEVRILPEYCEIDTYDRFGNVNATFKFDKEYLPLIYAHKWHCAIEGFRTQHKYLKATVGRKVIIFSRTIMNNPSAKVQFINGDTTDNRKINLKLNYFKND